MDLTQGLKLKANSPHELLDVVDESDNVISQELRSVVHNNNLIHRAVAILIYNSEGQVLVHKRSDYKEISSGKWSKSSGGHVKAGMDPLVSAYAELKQELGLEINLEFVHKELIKYDTETYFAYLYYGKSNLPAENIKFDRAEISAVKYIDYNEFKLMLAANEFLGKHTIASITQFFNFPPKSL